MEADLAWNSLPQVFNDLKGTINGIGTKIGENTAKATAYKEKILELLKGLKARVVQLQGNTGNVPALQQKLEESQKNLQEAQEKLTTQATEVARLNEDIRKLEELRGTRDRQIEELEEELKNLNTQNSTQELDNRNNLEKIAGVQSEIEQLQMQKADIEAQLQKCKDDSSQFVTQIGTVNARLAQEIEKINLIIDGLGDGTDVSAEIASIGDTLATIIQIINSPITSTSTRGGRRKTKKMRGGYLYSKKSNSNSSSISSSNSNSNSNSNSKSKSKSKSKSRRKKRLLNF